MFFGVVIYCFLLCLFSRSVCKSGAKVIINTVLTIFSPENFRLIGINIVKSCYCKEEVAESVEVDKCLPVDRHCAAEGNDQALCAATFCSGNVGLRGWRGAGWQYKTVELWQL